MKLRNPLEFIQPVKISEYVRRELLDTNLTINPELIANAHDDLLLAIKTAEIPLIVRKQGASGIKSMRGKNVQLSGVQRILVFSDNSPAVWLHHYLMMHGRYPQPGYQKLFELLRSAKVPMAMSYKGIEKAQMPEWPVLKKAMRVYPPIWTAGWKLSHIFPCNLQQANGNDSFARLEIEDQEKFQRIRFLRNMSPFNYFLSPMKKSHMMLVNSKSPRQNDLGEDELVISWVIRILHDEVFRDHQNTQNKFKDFLKTAGLGYHLDSALEDGEIVVTKKIASQPEKAKKKKTVLRPVNTKPKTEHQSNDKPSADDQAPSEAERDKIAVEVYQVNQGVSEETFCSILVSPDENKGGWLRIKDVNPRDVVLHAAKGKIVAISIVEPLDFNDERYDDYRRHFEFEVERETSWVLYQGKHFTIPSHSGDRFLTCMLTTVSRDLDYDKPSGFQGYMVRVPPDQINGIPNLKQAIFDALAAYDESLVEE